jgi:hypothetical protein
MHNKIHSFFMTCIVDFVYRSWYIWMEMQKVCCRHAHLLYGQRFSSRFLHSSTNLLSFSSVYVFLVIFLPVYNGTYYPKSFPVVCKMLSCIGQAHQETFIWIYDASPYKFGTLFHGCTALLGLASSLLRFRDHRHITLGWTPRDEWSARRGALQVNLQCSQDT